MALRLRVPGFLDVVMADNPEQIRELAGDGRLDRRFEAIGPLLNRFIARRIVGVLNLGGRPLPAVAPRDCAERARAQAALEIRLGAMTDAPCPPADLDRIAAYLRDGGPDAELGVVLQGIVGRLFLDTYRATPETFAAAVTFDAATRSVNPFRLLRWHVTGDVDAARRILSEAVGGDRAGVHTTGIAVHNLVAAFRRMRALVVAGELPRLTPPAATARALVAPGSVPRQASARGSTRASDFAPGTLVLLRLDAARATSARHDVAFMRFAWSRCPAGAFVPALLEAAWGRAAEQAEAAEQAKTGADR